LPFPDISNAGTDSANEVNVPAATPHARDGSGTTIAIVASLSALILLLIIALLLWLIIARRRSDYTDALEFTVEPDAFTEPYGSTESGILQTFSNNMSDDDAEEDAPAIWYE
jgi:hypothetical protein